MDPPPKSKCFKKCLGIDHDCFINCLSCGFILCQLDKDLYNCPICGTKLEIKESVSLRYENRQMKSTPKKNRMQSNTKYVIKPKL